MSNWRLALHSNKNIYFHLLFRCPHKLISAIEPHIKASVILTGYIKLESVGRGWMDAWWVATSTFDQGWEFSPPYKNLHRILRMHEIAHSSFRNSTMKTYPLILFTVAVLLPLAHGAGGAFITAWLESVGIKYVPPVPPTPMQNSGPTCTDCSKTDQVSSH